VRRLIVLAALGAIGSSCVALATDFPASLYGSQFSGIWPFAASGRAPTWEGPFVPKWAGAANNGVASGRLLPVLFAVCGVTLLLLAWHRLLRVSRHGLLVRIRTVWPVVACWVLPLFFAAPFASSDVWIYGAEGRAVLSGLSASTPVALLGHSVWLAGVDPKWALHPSFYGPTALDLSAIFVRISGGRPWVAIECWRFVAVLGLAVSGWAIWRCVGARRGDRLSAVIAGVTNPGVLVILVASVHNDAAMMALMMAGVAIATTGSSILAVILCALAVSIKAPAAIALLAVAWQRRRRGALGAGIALFIGAGTVLVVLEITGFLAHGGFAWLGSTTPGQVESAFASVGLLGTTSARAAGVVQAAGVVVACAVVFLRSPPTQLTRTLAVGMAVIVFTAATTQPWYLSWVLLLLVADGLETRSNRIVVICIVWMMAWAELPLGTGVWVLGVGALALVFVISHLAPRLGVARPGSGGLVRRTLGTAQSMIAPREIRSYLPGILADSEGKP
jgi:hypothetical protein